MKKARRLFILPAILVLIGCAKRGNPDGGPVDTKPPRFVRASPENFSTKFDSREIRIFFNEYIKLNEAQRQIIISPPMDPRPEITPLGTASRSVRIRINDTLQPNTTYTINFGRSIVDNNEGNPLDFFQYVFSTGNYLDSLSVSGVVTDAYMAQPDPFVSVMLYEVDSAYTDSVIYKETPRYITNTLDSTFFQLNNLKEGTYQMVGVLDKNNNYRFDPRSEKISFLQEFITVPTDSIYELSIFREIPPFRVTRPQKAAHQRVLFGYTGKLDKDSLQLKMISSTPEGFESRITKDPATDTLHYWYKPVIEKDSLLFAVEAPNYSDTLFVRSKTMDKDSLTFSFDPSGTLGFNRNVNILPTVPLEEMDDSLMSLITGDSVAVPFSAFYRPFENRVVLDFEKQEQTVYNFQALPGAFTGFYRAQNDTLKAQFRTRAYSDFGSLIINLQKVEEYPVIVQLTNEKGDLRAEQMSDSETSFTFRYLTPGKYLLRVIYDSNENGIWDTGNYLQKKQPEEIIYFPDVLDVRANWDQTFLFPL